MKQPTAFGRLVPRNDWEGDDREYANLSCTDTAAGRMVAWATGAVNAAGQAPHLIDRDGRVYRAALHPHDSDGITLEQAQKEVRVVAGLPLVIVRTWPLRKVKAHLAAGRGLMIAGRYDALPRAYRYQQGGAFLHRMFVAYTSKPGARLYDPLNPDVHGYGRWVPPQVIWDFIATLPEYGYVPLQPL
jgi:hypothetical protein